MREQREPWLKLPAKEPGSSGSPRADPRFRTHVVPIRRPSLPAAARSPDPPAQPLPEHEEPEFDLSLGSAGAQPSITAIERAAAAVTVARSATIRHEPRGAPPRVAPEPPHSTHKLAEPGSPGALSIGFDDLTPVSSSDWVVKVGEAAKIVDVVVVFYTAAYLGSEMFEFAFRTVVNEVLPRAGRPYTVYRFALDAEPGFVPELAASLGLPMDNAVSVAGFAWSGPGRRLFILGDRAFESQAVFQRSLRRSLRSEPADVSRTGEVRRQSIATIEHPRSGAARPWGGRVLAVLAWCLFGTAALGAAVLGVAPHWTSSLLRPTSVPGQGAATDNPSLLGNTLTGTTASPVNRGEAASAPDAGPASAPVKPAKPVRRTRPKHVPSLSLNPTYWGLPSEDRSR